MARRAIFFLSLACAGAAFAALPITFEENRGQVPSEVAYFSRGSGYRLFLTRQGAVIGLTDGRTVRINLANSIKTPPVGTRPMLAKTNYLLGPDSSDWKSGIANYEAVTFPHVYPGIDLVWHAHGDQIEHDFLVAPGSDPRQIELVFSGAPLQLTPAGDLTPGRFASTNRTCIRMAEK
jgi:hypothetical protein